VRIKYGLRLYLLEEFSQHILCFDIVLNPEPPFVILSFVEGEAFTAACTHDYGGNGDLIPIDPLLVGLESD
jgi:hypothetical protein